MNEDELWLDVLHPDDRERMARPTRGAREPHVVLRRVPDDRPRRAHRLGERARRRRRDEATGNALLAGRDGRHHDRKQAEEALAASERQYRSVFDAATIGLLTLDLDGRVRDANHGGRAVARPPARDARRVELWDDIDAGVDDAPRSTARTTAASSSSRCAQATARSAGSGS